MQTQQIFQYNQTLPAFSAAIFNQRGHVGRLFFSLTAQSLEAMQGVSGCHKRGGGVRDSKSHVGGNLSGFQGEEVARCPLSRPCRRRF